MKKMRAIIMAILVTTWLGVPAANGGAGKTPHLLSNHARRDERRRDRSRVRAGSGCQQTEPEAKNPRRLPSIKLSPYFS
jgi:hypothetical protein